MHTGPVSADPDDLARRAAAFDQLAAELGGTASDVRLSCGTAGGALGHPALLEAVEELAAAWGTTFTALGQVGELVADRTRRREQAFRRADGR